MIPAFIKKSRFSLFLIFVAILQFAILPRYHYHPEDTHAHLGELKPHHHPGHFHSPELERIAHTLNLHPTSPQWDRGMHHSHHFPEHDSDSKQYDFGKSQIPKAKFFQANEKGESVSTLQVLPPGFMDVSAPGVLLKLTFYSRSPLNRSPPSFFL